MVVSLSKSFGYFWANCREMSLGLSRSRLIHRENLTINGIGVTLKIKFFGRLAQLVRAFGLHPKCRWFESGSAHHLKAAIPRSCGFIAFRVHFSLLDFFIKLL